MIKKFLLVTAATGALAACGGSWSTDYQPIDPAKSKNWTVRDVQVSVPKNLTTSEVNTYTPNYDIVWHGEPYGDRRAQVAKIMDDGITAGTKGLRGPQPVTIAVTLKQFHAITPKVRYSLETAGVHNIQYTAQVFDAKGQPLTAPQFIQADLPALVGEAGNEADRKGFTQKVQIEQHLAKVTAGWLGIGPDVRSSFVRSGR
ncbi:DUF6778 family protein [Paracoccus sp. p4-l81]